MREDRRGEDGEERRRRGDTAAHPKNRGSAVCGGRGLGHKDAAVEPFNNFMASSDSSSPSELHGKRSWRSYAFNFVTSEQLYLSAYQPVIHQLYKEDKM